MKYKFITMVLCLSVLSFTACGNDTQTVNKNDIQTESIETEKSTDKLEQTEIQVSTENVNTEQIDSETTEVQVNSEQTEIIENTVTESEVVEETPIQQELQVKELHQTMYAKQSVNVRKGDSTDYEKIGSLSFNQQVKVTGQSETTGWYRIEFNGEIGFVSSNYLSTEKTVVATPPVSNANNNNQSSNQGTNNGGGGSAEEDDPNDDEPSDWETDEPSDDPWGSDPNAGPEDKPIELEDGGDGGDLITDGQITMP